MAAFNFPNSPSTNDLHTENNVTWKWNGTVWKRIHNSYLTSSTLDVSGIGTFGGKVGIADSIVHTGDENTSIRFPAADTVTAEVGGVELLRVNSSGVSIKNSTNTSAFCVGNIRGTASAPSFNETNHDGLAVDVYNEGNPYERHISLAARGYGNTIADMSFWTDSGSSVAERLRIASDGKIGIGEDDPDGNQLLIRAASTVGTTKGHIMLTGDGATNGEGPQIVFSESGSGSSYAGAYIGHIRATTNSTGHLVFATRATGGDANTVPTERLRITSAGLLGVGTNNPTEYIQIHESQNNTRAQITFTNNSTGATVNDGLNIGLDGSQNAIIHQHENTNLIFGTNDTERLRITSAGNVGIGSAIPTDILDIQTGSGDEVTTFKVKIQGKLELTRNHASAPYIKTFMSSGNPAIHLGDSSGDRTVIHGHGNSYFNAGDVLIGHTSSTAVSGQALPLQVQGSGGYTGASLIRTSAAGAQLQFAAGSSGNNIADNTGLGYIKFFGYHTNGYDEYARIHAGVDGTPGDGDAPGAIMFSTTNDGASSPTERARFTSGDQLLINRTTSVHSQAKLEIQGGTQHGESNYIQTWKGNSDDIAVRNMSDGDYEITNSQNGNQVALYDGSGGGRLEYYNNGNWMGMYENYAASNRAYSATTSGGTELRVTSQGYIRRASSTRRLKNNIREYVGVGVSAIKQIVPKLWEDHVEGSTKLGFIAEDIHSIGLTNAVEYEPYIGGSEIGIGVTYGDMYGNGTTPVTKTGEALDDEVLVVDGIDNTAIIAELVLAIKQLTARVEELESGG